MSQLINTQGDKATRGLARISAVMVELMDKPGAGSHKVLALGGELGGDVQWRRLV